MNCRPGCGACCIALSISSPIPAAGDVPGLPGGKPAGVRCPHLGEDRLCHIYDDPRRPPVCAALRASREMCGDGFEQAMARLTELEAATRPEEEVRVRHDFQPGDAGRLITLHGELYAKEYGFDATFEAYVAEPLARFVRERADRERLWLVDGAEPVMGSIAVVRSDERAAQLRWFLLHPSLRGRGLGRRLIGEALEFCRAAGYGSAFLWTVSCLPAAARLYRAAGFRVTEEHERTLWGRRLTEQRCDLSLTGGI